MPARTSSDRSRGLKRIFSLSIDEDLRWAIRHITSEGDYVEEKNYHAGIFCELPHTTKHVDLQSKILGYLSHLKQEIPEFLDEIDYVGVSTVGIVDSNKSRLINFDRKKWSVHSDENDDYYMVDFKSIFDRIFTNNSLVVVQNDATAKCLAEFSRQKEPKDSPLCYVNFHDGVNGAFVQGPINSGIRAYPIAPLMHQELGHIFPPLHERDFNFNGKYAGCAVHTSCFVSLAGSSRIKRQWGRGFDSSFSGADILQKNNSHRDKPWEIISHYMAHFCFNCLLTIPPKKILISGSTIFPELIPLISSYFRALNTYMGKSYIYYPEIDREDFISMASLPYYLAGVMGGIEIARKAHLDTLKLVPMRARATETKPHAT